MSSEDQQSIVNLACLEKVRLDSLKSRTKRSRCSVCDERLDRFEGTQECVTSLPCKHLVHGHCVIKRAMTRQTCPTCLFPMPTIEEEGPEAVVSDLVSKVAKSERLKSMNWHVVVGVSLIGVVIAYLFYRR